MLQVRGNRWAVRCDFAELCVNVLLVEPCAKDYDFCAVGVALRTMGKITLGVTNTLRKIATRDKQWQGWSPGLVDEQKLLRIRFPMPVGRSRGPRSV
jgi:hypothetical protein